MKTNWSGRPWKAHWTLTQGTTLIHLFSHLLNVSTNKNQTPPIAGHCVREHWGKGEYNGGQGILILHQGFSSAVNSQHTFISPSLPSWLFTERPNVERKVISYLQFSFLTSERHFPHLCFWKTLMHTHSSAFSRPVPVPITSSPLP